MIAILCLLLITVFLQENQNAEEYRLMLLDRSGTEKEITGTQAEEQTSDVDFTTIRVLIYRTDYSSVYHEQLTVQGTVNAVTIDCERILGDFEQLKKELQDNGIVFDTYSLKDAGQDTAQKDEASLLSTAYYLEMADGSCMKLLSVERSCGYPQYRGRLILYPEQGNLVIVNELGLEEYLYGVLPSEMPASYEPEALKAQAVCARTFACGYLYHEKYPQYHAALDDSTSCQVYANQREQPQTSQAVDQTKGILLWNGDIPAETFYYSTSCGLSADITVWPDYDPEMFSYLSAHTMNEDPVAVDFSDDPEGIRFYTYLSQAHGDYEENLPWYRWFCTITDPDLSLMSQKMAQRYQIKPDQIQKYQNGILIEEPPGEIDAITDIFVTKRSAGGSVLEICMTTSDASYLISGEYNIRYILCDNHTKVTKRDGSEQIMTMILPSSFFILDPILDKEQIIGYSVSGGGFGHGVGMSQNGADVMAQSGMDYVQILNYFYPGTTLKPIA